jgi:acetoin utilization protein AcuB
MMSKGIPTIQRYMTTTPLSVSPRDTLAHANSVMHDNDIRHLPVIDLERLVGIITERDLALAANLQGVDPTLETVKAAMNARVFSVAPDSPLDQVAGEMAAGKFGSAVVVQNQRVVGVVTTVDICRALSELLRTRLG